MFEEVPFILGFMILSVIISYLSMYYIGSPLSKIFKALTLIGIVIHESSKPATFFRRKGPIVGEISEAYADVPAGLIEKFAILRALEVALERGYRVVKVWSDNNCLRSIFERSRCCDREAAGR